jgi:hypothetical protein
MDHKGKGIVINGNENEILNATSQKVTRSPTQVRITREKDKKKRCIKKIIYYDNDASSSSLRDDDNEDSSMKKKTVNQNYSFDYSRIPYNSKGR